MTVDITCQKASYRALAALDATTRDAAVDADLDGRLVELIRIRASQLNGCAYCLRMHTRDAVAAGETADRLAVLPAWRESQYFSDVEQAALRITEHVTRLGDVGEPDDVDTDPLTDDQVAAVTWLAITMNAWNRVAVCSHYEVAP